MRVNSGFTTVWLYVLEVLLHFAGFLSASWSNEAIEHNPNPQWKKPKTWKEQAGNECYRNLIFHVIYITVVLSHHLHAKFHICSNYIWSIYFSVFGPGFLAFNFFLNYNPIVESITSCELQYFTGSRWTIEKKVFQKIAWPTLLNPDADQSWFLTSVWSLLPTLPSLFAPCLQ